MGGVAVAPERRVTFVFPCCWDESNALNYGCLIDDMKPINFSILVKILNGLMGIDGQAKRIPPPMLLIIGPCQYVSSGS